MNLFKEAGDSPHGSLFDLSGYLELSRSVFPIVFHQVDDQFSGLGSCFCVSHEGVFATAMHVVSDTIKQANEKAITAGALGIVFIPGLVFGRAVMQPFRVVPEFRLFPGEPDPLAFGRTDPDLSKIVLDLASFSPQLHEREKAVPLWVRTGRSRRVQIGDELIAVGYDQIVGAAVSADSVLNYQHSLKGCVVGVHQLEVRRESRTRSGPTIILDVNLPPGFSGGPVFAKDGAVVGIVSTGNTAANYATLVWTELLPEEGSVFVGQDHSNQNWFVAWGVFVGEEHEPRQMFWREGEAKIAARAIAGAEVAKGSRPDFDDQSFVRSERR